MLRDCLADICSDPDTHVFYAKLRRSDRATGIKSAFEVIDAWTVPYTEAFAASNDFPMDPEQIAGFRARRRAAALVNGESYATIVIVARCGDVEHHFASNVRSPSRISTMHEHENRFLANAIHGMGLSLIDPRGDSHLLPRLLLGQVPIAARGHRRLCAGLNDLDDFARVIADRTDAMSMIEALSELL